MKTIKEELEQIIWEVEEGMLIIGQLPVYLKKLVKRIEDGSKITKIHIYNPTCNCEFCQKINKQRCYQIRTNK